MPFNLQLSFENMTATQFISIALSFMPTFQLAGERKLLYQCGCESVGLRASSLFVFVRLCMCTRGKAAV